MTSLALHTLRESNATELCPFHWNSISPHGLDGLLGLLRGRLSLSSQAALDDDEDDKNANSPHEINDTMPPLVIGKRPLLQRSYAVRYLIWVSPWMRASSMNGAIFYFRSMGYGRSELCGTRPMASPHATLMPRIRRHSIMGAALRPD